VFPDFFRLLLFRESSGACRDDPVGGTTQGTEDSPLQSQDCCGAYTLFSRGKATIYRSGKYIIYGLATLDEVDASYREVLALISPLIDPSLATTPEVRNIVGMNDLPIEIPLSRLVVALRMERFEYEPEQFPGLL